VTVSDRRLASVLIDFAHTMGTDFPVREILDRLVVSIVDILPITSAGVTFPPKPEPRYVAASSQSAARLEQLQTELEEGPRLEAVRTSGAVMVTDLRSEERFPRFTPPALASGLAAMFTFPLRQRNPDLEPLGALDLYCDAPQVLDIETVQVAQTLADVAAAYLINGQARTELQEATDRARHMALHDGLTGLPNRILLIERLHHAVQRGRRSHKPVAVLFADLDRFKAVNDTFGHPAGDELLVAVAERMSAVLRPGDTLARLSGDEFVILCEELDDASSAEIIAGRLGAALVKPFTLSGQPVTVTASVGIAFAGPGDDVPERLLREADTAMYRAKQQGGRHHHRIDPS